MSNRDSLIAYLEHIMSTVPELEDVQIVKSARAVDKLNKPTLIVRTDNYEPLTAAPLKKSLGHFLATLVSPLTDPDDAEDQLDDILQVFLPLLIKSQVMWRSATQVGWGAEGVAYDITIDSILT